MRHELPSQRAEEWSQGERRAESYLRALRGRLGLAERRLVSRALTLARQRQADIVGAHPVTLVMEALFNSLPGAATLDPAPMAPPISRTIMLPEESEFPFHNWLHRLFRARPFAVAGPN